MKLPALLATVVVANLTLPSAAAAIPLVEITSPVACLGITAADVPPVSTYRWETVAASEDPDSIRFIFLSTQPFGNDYAATIQYIRTNPNSPDWSDWQAYFPPDMGTSWTSPSLDYGDYVLAVHGKDVDGNVDGLFEEPRNVRRIKVAPRLAGPTLTLTSPYHDPVVSFLTTTPPAYIELASETPIVFCWTAQACHYGGTVESYRFAWDLIDPDDDSQWPMPFTPFLPPQDCCLPPPECSPEMTLIPYGIHTFYVEARDNSGYKSRASVQVTWRQTGSPARPWSRSFGDSQGQHSISVAIDGAGDVLLAGDFAGSFSFGGGPVSGSSDMFLAKLNRFGTHLWSKGFTGTSIQSMRDVAVDASGNVVIAGHFYNTVDFGGGPLTSTSLGSTDVFVAKYDANGAHLWSKRSVGVGDERTSALAMDGAGTIIVTGDIVTGSANFGGANLPLGMFLVKFAPDGAHVWSRSLGGSFGSVADVQTDTANRIVLGGNFLGTVDFGGGPLTSVGGADVFVAMLQENGTHVWSRRAGDALDQFGAAVAVDATGEVALAGSFYGTVDFGVGAHTSAGSTDLLLAKFASDGASLWSRRFGDASTQVATGAAVGPHGDIVTTGYFSGVLDFGGTPLTSAGLADFFVAKFDGSGDLIRSRHFGDATNQLAIRVTVDASDDAVVFGEFNGVVDFGTGTHTSAGSQDLVVARLDSSIPVGVTPETIVRTAVSNYPNPFNPSTTIVYELPAAGAATLAVYDARGARVRVLADGAHSAGPHRALWDGRDAHGVPASSGVYFVRLTFGREAVSHKLVLLK